MTRWMLWLVAAAGASQVILNDPDDALVITSPYGPILRHYGRGVCAAELVFVGTIASVEGPAAGPLRVSFALERRLKGEPTSPFVLELSPYQESLPEGVVIRPEVGRRYLVAATTLKQAGGGRPVGAILRTATLPLDPAASFAPDAVLREELDAWCLDEDLAECLPPTDHELPRQGAP